MIDSSINVEAQPQTTALRRRSRAQEALFIEQRRELVAHFRFVEQLTEVEIVDELAKVGFVVNRSTVSRDIEAKRGKFRQVFRHGGFDARSEVGILIEELRFVVGSSFRDAKAASDGKERALHRQVALHSIEKLSTLLQNVGLVQERDFMLPPDELKKADPIPSGNELRARFDAINVQSGELVSEAEKAWSYGDAAPAEAAANVARRDARRLAMTNESQ